MARMGDAGDRWWKRRGGGGGSRGWHGRQRDRGKGRLDGGSGGHDAAAPARRHDGQRRLDRWQRGRQRGRRRDGWRNGRPGWNSRDGRRRRGSRRCGRNGRVGAGGTGGGGRARRNRWNGRRHGGSRRNGWNGWSGGGERRGGAARVAAARRDACAAGQTQCTGGACANLVNDNANCGMCGRAVPRGRRAATAPACAGRRGRCCAARARRRCAATLTNDTANCGACGNACASGQTCTNGVVHGRRRRPQLPDQHGHRLRDAGRGHDGGRQRDADGRHHGQRALERAQQRVGVGHRAVGHGLGQLQRPVEQDAAGRVRRAGDDQRARRHRRAHERHRSQPARRRPQLHRQLRRLRGRRGRGRDRPVVARLDRPPGRLGRLGRQPGHHQRRPIWSRCRTRSSGTAGARAATSSRTWWATAIRTPATRGSCA